MPHSLNQIGGRAVREDSLVAFLAHHAALDPEGWPSLGRHPPALPEPETGEIRMRWAPGARDGVGIFHVRPPEPSTVHLHVDRLLDAARAFLQGGSLEPFETAATDAGALTTVEALLSRVLADLPLPPDALAALVCAVLAESATPEAIKLALALAGLLRGGTDFEPVLRLCAVHDEFTLYAGVALLDRGADPEATWLAIAQRVYGWGRVHAVHRLCAQKVGPLARRWLLTEGSANDVLPAYTALTIAEQTDPIVALGDAPEDTALLNGLGALYEGLCDEGPCAGMSAWESGAEFCAALAEALARAPLSAERLNTLLRVRTTATTLGEASAARAQSAVESVLAREDFEPSLRSWLRDEGPETRRAARQVLRALDRDAREEAFLEIERAPHETMGWFEAADGADEPTLARVVERARAHLAPDALATGATTAVFDRDPRGQCMDFVLQALRTNPRAGVDLLASALAMPTVRARHMALQAAALLPVADRSGALRDALERCAGHDPDEKLRSAAREVAAGRPYPESSES